MPGFSLQHEHALGQAESLSRMTVYVAKLIHRHGEKASDVECEWQENSLTFSASVMGMAMSGIMLVLDDRVQIDGTIPFAAMLIKGRIEQGIRSELTRVLS
jgi:hypothetical protein